MLSRLQFQSWTRVNGLFEDNLKDTLYYKRESHKILLDAKINKEKLVIK